jgi:alpha-tubulin suppressor-like RCC1 family protein
VPAPGPATTHSAAAPPALACAEGTGNCDGNAANACETSLSTSAAHCGACGTVCGAGEACLSGSCRVRKLLDAADSQACAVTEAGAVRCWGDNSARAILPAAEATAVSIPGRVEGIGRVMSIDTSETGTCAVLDSGKVTCWGEGKIKEIPFLTDVVDLALSNGTLCVATASGDLKCIELSFSSPGVSAADSVPALHDVTALTGGRRHFCALHKSGEVTCWGDPDMLGAGEPDPDADDSSARRKPAHVKGLSDVVQIAAGEAHTCAVRKNKRVSCWGKNWYGQLGDGTTDNRDAPVEVGFLTDAASVAAGPSHTCVVRATGEVACFGAGDRGQLGDGGVRPSSAGPLPVKGMADAVSVTAGAWFSCALHKTGAVSCWGSASRGELGRGTSSEYPRPTPVAGVAGAISVVAGPHHSCALDAKGQARCWGIGSSDWGNGSEDELKGLPPELVGGGRELKKIFGNFGVVCALPRAGDPFCFDGHRKADDPEIGRPFVVTGLGATKEIYGYGRGFTNAALLASGQAVLWTLKSGKPDTYAKLSLSGLSDVATMAAYDDSLCAVRRSGRVACVGFSAFRTFQAKDPAKPTAAVEVPELKDAVSIAVGSGEYCVVRKTGEAACFSTWSIPRPLAKDQKPPKEKPKPIELRPLKGVTDATMIATSAISRCVLRKSGEVSCSGNNSSGQLGTGDFEYHSEPVGVSGLKDAVSIVLAAEHACAARKTGEVVCWGSNNNLQAGQNEPPYQMTPQPILEPK